ncbi:MAG TPA: ADP-ribosylglycohydrolase family protein [Planctomycetota bacterium]|nr:ADP-ribosylglycohydrolase family protein [Planctomycetota bacterium]
MTDLAFAARGAILGVLVGDALGVPVEGMGRDEFEPVTGMRGGGSHLVPAGTFSDDGSMTLCTVESLVEKGGLDEADLGDRLVRFLFNRHWAARRVTFGVGFTTREAILRIRDGREAAKAGLDDEDSNGNGALTRLAPIALFAHARKLSAADTVELAHRATRITHAHPRAQLVSGFYALIARGLLEGKKVRAAIEAMREEAANLYASDPWNSEYRHVQRLMERNLATLDRHEVHSTAYVVDSLEAVLWCLLHEGSLEETVLEAVNLGEDSDGTGSIAGGLVGMIHGAAAIPDTWKNELARLDEVEALIARFTKTLS